MRPRTFQQWINEDREPNEYEKTQAERQRLRELGLIDDPMPEIFNAVKTYYANTKLQYDGSIDLTIIKYDRLGEPTKYDVTITEYGAPEGYVRILWSWLFRFGKSRPESRHQEIECLAIPGEVVRKLKLV